MAKTKRRGRVPGTPREGARAKHRLTADFIALYREHTRILSIDETRAMNRLCNEREKAIERTVAELVVSDGDVQIERRTV